MRQLTELQEKWLQELEQHPERQITGRLGEIEADGTIHACCLGQAVLCLKPELQRQGAIIDNYYSSCLSDDSYKDFELIDNVGRLIVDANVNERKFKSLADMNDDGATWPEIAAYIRANPDNVFV